MSNSAHRGQDVDEAGMPGKGGLVPCVVCGGGTQEGRGRDAALRDAALRDAALRDMAWMEGHGLREGGTRHEGGRDAA